MWLLGSARVKIRTVVADRCTWERNLSPITPFAAKTRAHLLIEPVALHRRLAVRDLAAGHRRAPVLNAVGRFNAPAEIIGLVGALHAGGRAIRRGNSSRPRHKTCDRWRRRGWGQLGRSLGAAAHELVVTISVALASERQSEGIVEHLVEHTWAGKSSWAGIEATVVLDLVVVIAEAFTS